LAPKWGVDLYTGKYVTKTHCELSPLIRVFRTMCRAAGLIILFSFKVVDGMVFTFFMSLLLLMIKGAKNNIIIVITYIMLIILLLGNTIDSER